MKDSDVSGFGGGVGKKRSQCSTTDEWADTTADEEASTQQNKRHARANNIPAVVTASTQQQKQEQNYQSVQKTAPSSSSKKANHDKREESGHLAVQAGQVLGDRFTVRALLGEGTFGKVWQCNDAKHSDVVAVKCVRKIDRYIVSAKIEAKILRQIYYSQEAARVELLVKLYTTFMHQGHYCMVFEPLGKSLLDYIQENDYHAFPLHYVRAISAQVLSALAFLHVNSLVHTDLKLENVLFVPGEDVSMEVEVLSPRGGGEAQGSGGGSLSARIRLPRCPNVKIIDFGGATFNDERKSSIVNTRQYRGPEVTLELGWSYPSDVWSAACMLAELSTGDLLFSTHDNLEHLAMMERTVGRFPAHMVQRSPVAKQYFYRDNGRLRLEQLSQKQRDLICRLPPIVDVCARPTVSTSAGRGSNTTGSRAHIWESVQDLTDVLAGCLRLDPAERDTALEALRLPFFNQLEVSHGGWILQPQHALVPGAVQTR